MPLSFIVTPTFRYTWPATLVPPEGIPSVKLRVPVFHQRYGTEKANHLHIGIVHLSPRDARRTIPFSLRGPKESVQVTGDYRVFFL